MALHTGTFGPVIRADNMEPEVLRQLVSILSGSRDGIEHGTDFGVTQNGGGAMSVIVSSGFALLTGTDSAPVQGQYHAYNDANVTVTIATANGSNPRIDLVTIAIGDVFYGGAGNVPTLQSVAGAPAASPSVPATPADSLVLAHIYVGTAAASILTANINGITGAGNPDTIPFTPFRCEGLLAKARGTGGTVTSVATPGTTIPGLSVNVNVPAGRNIRVRFTCQHTDSAAVNNNFMFISRDTAATILTDSYSSWTATVNGVPTNTGEVIDNPTAGMHTYMVNAYSGGANTQTYVAARGTLTVEDIGPV